MPIQHAAFLGTVDAVLASLFELHLSVAWYYDWKLYLGLTLWGSTWAKWLIAGYSGSFHWKFAYTLGINLVTLHCIQYNGQKGLLGIMIALALQTVGTTFIWWKDINVVKTGHFNSTSLYQDLSTPLMQTCTVFIGQMCLIIFYLSSIFNSLRTHSLSYIFWLASFFCLQMAAFFNRSGDSYIGTTWHSSQWSSIVQVANDVEFVCKGFGGRTDVHIKSRNELLTRGVFGFFVNNIFRDVLAFTIPILLSQFTSALDFVVYCVGVNFIVTIDDMQPKRFDVRCIASKQSELGSYIELNHTETAAVVAPPLSQRPVVNSCDVV